MRVSAASLAPHLLTGKSRPRIPNAADKLPI